MLWAARGVNRNDWTPIRAGLGVSLVFGLIYCALIIVDLAQVSFSYQTNAYGSLYFIIAAFQLVTVAGGLVANAVTLFWALRSSNAGEQQSVTDLALYWGYLALSGIIVFFTLYILPYVI
jgi:cytochrome c oxidase subunit 3